MNTDIDLDGRIGEGWSGTKPDGSHVNVVLARRGTPDRGRAARHLRHAAPGHTPILVVVGEREPSTSRSGRRR